MADALFAVVDVETTGFSPLVGDRIIEVAILRTGADGAIEDEYETLVNPGRVVGPSDLHGIAQADVESAPTFEEIAGDILERIQGLILVGHNVRYDREFIAAELSAAGIFLPTLPCLCTLKMAHRLHPDLGNFRLATCCAALGFDDDQPHEALAEARATARLLARYLLEASAAGLSTTDVIDGTLAFPAAWPELLPSGKVLLRAIRARNERTPPFLTRIAADRKGSVTDENVAIYIDLLDRVLEDRMVTEREALALEETARAWGLSQEQVRDAHESYLRALVVAALADGWVTTTERHDLQTVVALLGLEPHILEALLTDVAEDAE